MTRPVAIGILAALLAAIPYAFTVDFGLGYGDAAELALAVHERGVTHPPGYPLYVFFGALADRVFSDSAAVTAFLSLAGTLVAVGTLSALTAAWTGPIGGLFAGLLFAVYPYTWEAATETEIYNVNMAVVGIATALLAWPGLRGRRRVAAGIVSSAASLGTSPANVLLFPGWLLLLVHNRRKAWRRYVVGFAVCVGVAGLCILWWTTSRAHTSPPMGTPTNPTNVFAFLRYVTGVDYGVLSPRTVTFYLARTLHHPSLFASDMAVVGVALSLVGLAVAWRRERAITASLALLALGNAGYFTYHIWPDYRAMVTPATFVACGFAGVGLHAWSRWSKRSHAARRVVTALLLVGIPFIVGLRGLRYVRDTRSREPADAFVAEAFDALPERAVVLTRWLYLTPLVYAQRVRGERPDIRLIEVADGPRHAPSGVVPDWRSVVWELRTVRPIVTNVPAVRQASGWRTTPLSNGWWRVHPE